MAGVDVLHVAVAVRADAREVSQGLLADVEQRLDGAVEGCEEEPENARSEGELGVVLLTDRLVDVMEEPVFVSQERVVGEEEVVAGILRASRPPSPLSFRQRASWRVRRDSSADSGDSRF